MGAVTFGGEDGTWREGKDKSECDEEGHGRGCEAGPRVCGGDQGPSRTGTQAAAGHTETGETPAHTGARHNHGARGYEPRGMVTCSWAALTPTLG